MVKPREGGVKGCAQPEEASAQQKQQRKPRTPMAYDSRVDGRVLREADEADHLDRAEASDDVEDGPVPAPNNSHNDGAAWAEYAEELAAWTMKWMVNRNDAWGQYRPLDQRSNGRAYTRKGKLDTTILVRHYEGAEVSDLICLHTTSPENTSRWFGVDIDHHSEPDKEIKRRNRKAAKTLYKRAKALGFHPLLFDSNGQGGYHLILLFKQPVETPTVHTFGQWLVRDWEELGLLSEPEMFPKQPRLEEGKKYGNFLRLLGRHHTLDFYTRVWTGEKWVSGEEAIKLILSTKGVASELISAEAGEFMATLPGAAESPPSIPPEKVAYVRQRALALIHTVKAVQNKGGDKATWTVAKYLVTDFALSVEQALPLMKEWNATHCQPSWPEEELLRKLRLAEQEPDQRGRLLAEALKGFAAGMPTPADGSGTPFLMEVPDFILADWERMRPRFSSRRGRPRMSRALMLVFLYAAAFCQRSSRLCLPDVVLSQLLVQGEGTPRWPQKNWRRALRQILKRLHWVNELDLNSRSACSVACPLHDRTDVPHRHFWFTFANPQDFLGLLHHFWIATGVSDDTTIFSYDFRGRESHHPDAGVAEGLNKGIKQATKDGRLWRIYLPAWLFGQVALKRGPCRILMALTREMTRSPGRRDRPGDAKVYPGSAHPILDKAKKYVGFNGNGGPHYHGKGYKLNEWMRRAGRDVNVADRPFWKAVRRFLADLDTLREPFGLVAGGYRGDMRKWYTLDALIPNCAPCPGGFAGLFLGLAV